MEGIKKYLKNPLIVALDLDHQDECLKIADQLSSLVGGFKIGPRLTVRYGADFISKLSRRGLVFVDNKYLDIPSVMEASVRATFEAGATLTTVHGWAGFEALSRLSKLEKELNTQRPFKILGVTILTSFVQEGLSWPMNTVSLNDQVEKLSLLISESGLTGLVCSAAEVSALKNKYPHFFMVTPGIRLENEALEDQKRVDSPKKALQFGSSALVVGRPIIESKNPLAIAKQYLSAMDYD